MIAKRKGRVMWDDIKADIEKLQDYEWEKACGYNCNSSEKRAKFKNMTMAEYQRWVWNNPDAGQNIYKMYEGIVVPDGKDENGNLIYKYNG